MVERFRLDLLLNSYDRGTSKVGGATGISAIPLALQSMIRGKSHIELVDRSR
jgi:hypothetical protein